MNKNSWLTITFLLLTFSLAAQEISIPEGIYRSVSEFNKKSPFLPLYGRLKRDTATVKNLFRSASVPNIGFAFENKENRKKNDRKIGTEIFGVSDGENFYLNGCSTWCNYSKTAFYKVLMLNKRYGISRKIWISPNGRGIGNFVIDFETGKDEPLSKKLIKKLLKNNNSLFQEFKNEENKNDIETLLKYLFLHTKTNT